MTFLHSGQNPDTRLSSKEILEISEHISAEFAPEKTGATSDLVLLPVDPYHLYAYWTLEDSHIRELEADSTANNLNLRIYWRPDADQNTANTKLWFDVSIHAAHGQCEVRLPIDEAAYSGELGIRGPANKFTVVVHSNLICVPRGRMALCRHDDNTDGTEISENSHVDSGLQKESIAFSTTGPFYDEVAIDSKIYDTLRQKGIMNLHLPESDPVKSSGIEDFDVTFFDEAFIDTEINQTLYEKGINFSLAPENESLKKTHCMDKNLSGQGCKK